MAVFPPIAKGTLKRNRITADALTFEVFSTHYSKIILNDKKRIKDSVKRNPLRRSGRLINQKLLAHQPKITKKRRRKIKRSASATSESLPEGFIPVMGVIQLKRKRQNEITKATNKKICNFPDEVDVDEKSKYFFNIHKDPEIQSGYSVCFKNPQTSMEAEGIYESELDNRHVEYEEISQSMEAEEGGNYIPQSYNPIESMFYHQTPLNGHTNRTPYVFQDPYRECMIPENHPHSTPEPAAHSHSNPSIIPIGLCSFRVSQLMPITPFNGKYVRTGLFTLHYGNNQQAELSGSIFMNSEEENNLFEQSFVYPRTACCNMSPDRNHNTVEPRPNVFHVQYPLSTPQPQPNLISEPEQPANGFVIYSVPEENEELNHLHKDVTMERKQDESYVPQTEEISDTIENNDDDVQFVASSSEEDDDSDDDSDDEDDDSMHECETLDNATPAPNFTQHSLSLNHFETGEGQCLAYLRFEELLRRFLRLPINVPEIRLNDFLRYALNNIAVSHLQRALNTPHIDSPRMNISIRSDLVMPEVSNHYEYTYPDVEAVYSSADSRTYSAGSPPKDRRWDLVNPDAPNDYEYVYPHVDAVYSSADSRTNSARSSPKERRLDLVISDPPNDYEYVYPDVDAVYSSADSTTNSRESSPELEESVKTEDEMSCDVPSLTYQSYTHPDDVIGILCGDIFIREDDCPEFIRSIPLILGIEPLHLSQIVNIEEIP